jgi:hypothetical protein
VLRSHKQPFFATAQARTFFLRDNAAQKNLDRSLAGQLGETGCAASGLQPQIGWNARAPPGLNRQTLHTLHKLQSLRPHSGVGEIIASNPPCQPVRPPHLHQIAVFPQNQHGCPILELGQSAPHGTRAIPDRYLITDDTGFAQWWSRAV